MIEYHILNLGAGVQSTTVYLLARQGKLKIDKAIFADTGEEPHDVYRHLAYLQSLQSPEIMVRTAGKLGDDLLAGRNSTGGRFASIPAFTAPDHATRTGKVKEGILRRQCTKEYKVDVVERTIRREIVGLQPRQRMPKDVRIVQYFGISTDEAARAERLKKRFLSSTKWATPVFPLIEMGWTRKDCLAWLEDKLPHKAPVVPACSAPTGQIMNGSCSKRLTPKDGSEPLRLTKACAGPEPWRTGA